MLSKGDKVFIITRRLFGQDRIRMFVGEVQATTDMAMKVHGYVFVHDDFTNEIVRREDTRTRIISLVDAVNNILVLPKEVDLENVQYKLNDMNERVITDNDLFTMNLNEFGASK